DPLPHLVNHLFGFCGRELVYFFRSLRCRPIRMLARGRLRFVQPISFLAYRSSYLLEALSSKSCKHTQALPHTVEQFFSSFCCRLSCIVLLSLAHEGYPPAFSDRVLAVLLF